jgi:putative membrane protein
MQWTGLNAVVCAAALTVACAGDGRDTRDNDSNRVVGTSGQAEHGATGDARHFAEKAAYAGNAEVKLGQLASERTQNPAVKEFAQMMVRDHSKAGNELKQAVKAHDVSPPAGLDPEHQQLYDRLSRLRGAEFDREYMKAMVDGHKKVRSMLEGRTKAHLGPMDRNRATGTSGTAGSSTQLDTAVNQWASKSLPRVEEHLQKAEDLQGKVSAHSGDARH